MARTISSPLGARRSSWGAEVSAAGGRVSDARGEPLAYRSGDLDLSHGVLAANPALHAELQRRIELE